MLTIAGAEAAIAAAVQRGAELNFTALNIVVVDRSGCSYASQQDRLACGMTASGVFVIVGCRTLADAHDMAGASDMRQSLSMSAVGCRNGDVKASRRGDGASVASYILTKEKAYTAANFGITSSTVAQRFGGANSTAFTPLVVNQVCTDCAGLPCGVSARVAALLCLSMIMLNVDSML